MDGSGSMQSNEERGAEKLMDDYLRAIGLHRKKIAKDGSCLFRAVAEQVLHCQSLHTKVRAKCVEFLKENRESYEAFIEGDFEDYLFKLQDPQQWVGEVEINALAVMYKRDFLIFQEPGKPAVSITDNNFKDKVQLCFLNGNHYDSVYPISRIKGAALCQSILYELLYDGVFKEDRSALTLCQRAGRPSDLLSDDSMNACVSSDDDDAGEPDEALWVENGTTARPNNQGGRGRGRGRHLPERVRRSLNPTLFRNIEFDVWHKSKRAQQKMDYCIAAGMQYAVGDRCQVRVEGSGRSYNATIRELSANNGPVTVYLEETGTRKQVPLWSLRPPTSDEKSWSTVVRDKRLSNGHGEWEERTKGRGRGKPAPASSPSVALATGPAFSGRVQKQHSWPQSSPVEEPGGAKASRKSCLADIGLTDTQRSAKKVEEMNVALVEIQLRDEHSFPALGAQAGMTSDGGRKKGGDKRRSQRNKTKSPVEDVRAPSPSGGERPKSSTPPLASAAPAAAPPAAAPPLAPAATPNPTNASLPAAPSANSSSSDPAKTKTAAPPPSPPASAPPARPPATGGAAAAPPPSATLFLTPALPATPPSSSSSLPTKSSASPPPSSSLPPPTFIAPIAPSPTAAQGFLPPSSLPRCSPPPSSLPHSPSPPSFPSSSPLVHEAPPLSAQSSSNLGGTQTIQAPLYQTPPQPQIQSQISVPQTQTQVSLTHGENQTQTPQVPMPHVHTEAQPFLPQPQSHTEAASLPQSRIQPPLPQTQYLSRSQSEVVPPSHPAPGAYYHPPQASGLASVHPQPSAPHPHLHVQPAHPPHPPHPSQVPHPSLALSASQTSNTQSLSQGLLPQPYPESPVHAPPQPSHPPHPSPHPSHHPQLQSAPPPHHQSIQPLQQLSQLYLDPLYPGFPQGETGDPAPIPPYSSSKSGDDLPPDLNMLRFFFNLGVKAYSMPMFPPYIYLYPLQQAHTMHPKLPSRSPSPTPHYPPSRHQEAYPHPQYPPASAPMPPQYDHQAPPAEPPHPSEPTFNQAEYPPPQPQPHRMPCPSLPWQHHQMPAPRNPSYAVGYPNQSPSYRATPPLSQGFHPGQGPGQLLYSQYPPSSMGYQSSSAPPDDLQVSHGLMEQHQPANGDSMPCQGPSRLPALLESPASANVANANNNRTVVVPGFALKKDPGDGLTRAVLLVDPPLNNRPIITLVPNPDIKDVSMATMNPRSSPGSPLPYDIISKTTVLADNKSSRGYRGNRKPIHPANTYVPLGGAEPGHMGFLPTGAMGEALSVGCSTEDDWEEAAGFKPATMNHRGPRRNPRGGRGRGGHDPGRGAHRRRHGGEPGELNYVQFSSSHRGRGRERGYM